MGRAEELGVIDEVLAGLESGRFAALELRGEPGIGKTRLLAELGERADGRGWLVLSGSASELERDLPFSVFVDALDEYLQGLNPSSFAGLGEDLRTQLAHVFPALSAIAPAGHLVHQHERHRTHRAVRALLEYLATTKPLVLVLDDLHWGDSASLELLPALLRRPPAAAVLVAFAVRPRRLPQRLSPTLERAHREATLTRVELGALSLVEASEFLGDAIDSAVAAYLYEESGGNPFYLEQLARSLDRRGADVDASETSIAGIEVPPAVAASLSEELALLSEAACQLVMGAAVVGDPFEPELAAAAAGSESAAMDAVDELLRIDVIRTTDVPRRFRFRHPLVRRAVYETTAAGWRLGAHERCAEALAARGASAVRRAPHIERSAGEGDLGAVAVLREAGEEALQLAPASAAHWFAAALRVLPESGSTRERIELLRAHAAALAAVGRLSDSHSVLLDAIAYVPDDWHVMRAELARACAGVEGALGQHEQAGSRLVNALDAQPDPASPEAVTLMIELAINAFWQGRYPEMQATTDRALLAARRLGHPALTAASLAVLALADSMAGAPGRIEAARAEGAALVSSLSDAELAGGLDAAAWFAATELYLDRCPETDSHAGGDLTLVRAIGQGDLFRVLVQLLGRAWFVRGKLTEAAELLDGAIEATRLSGNPQALAWNLSNRSVVALAVGDVELGLATAEESLALCRQLGAGFNSAWAAVRLAGALLEAGQPATAVDLLLDCAGGETQELIPGSWRVYSLELLTRCRLALDRPEEARRTASNAATWASNMQLPLAAAWAARAAAAVDLHAGNYAPAAEHALASAAAADEVGAPIEAALARTLAGQAFARAGLAARAVEELVHAAATLDAYGALRYRDRADRELRMLGHRIHRRSRPGKAGVAGIESLTERELQVTRLVMDRKTNAEIAAELFLSRKTVETHLRNIFHKVNVSSRVELARAVERSERTGTGDPGVT